MTAIYQTPKRSLLARLRLHTWRGRFAWLAGLIAILLLAVWMLARITPSWYRPLDPSDQGVIDAAGRAQNLLYFELQNATQRTPLGEQRWSISQDEINAFLAINFAAPLTPDGTRLRLDPAQNPISAPAVVFSRGKIAVSARAAQLPGPSPQGGVATLIFSVATVTGPDGQPMGQVTLDSAWIGCLPVPRSLVERRIHSLIPAVTAAVNRAVEVQIGAHDVPMVEDALRSAAQGQPFPLKYRSGRKELIIREIRVDEGAFSLILARSSAALPVPPASSPIPLPK